MQIEIVTSLNDFLFLNCRARYIAIKKEFATFRGVVLSVGTESSQSLGSKQTRGNEKSVML